MGQPKVSVVLVNFRGINDTLSAIESIQKSNYPKDLIEIVVVDNDSNDDSVEKLKELKNQIKLVISETNLGFAGGVNLGIKNSSGEIVGLLNSDAKCDSNWITSAVNTLLECIVRNTPIIVNKHPAVVELLGENYPLYYTNSLNYLDLNLFINELLKNSNIIRKTHNYLKKIDKNKFKIENFRKELIKIFIN